MNLSERSSEVRCSMKVRKERNFCPRRNVCMLGHRKERRGENVKDDFSCRPHGTESEMMNRFYGEVWV